jgi:phosphoglycerate dehydrogenase-like enzyme
MARLEAECDVERHDGPGELTHDELVRRVAGKEAIVAQITDKVDRAVVEAGSSLRIIANAPSGSTMWTPRPRRSAGSSLPTHQAC